jgi:hypothetical protein
MATTISATSFHESTSIFGNMHFRERERVPKGRLSWGKGFLEGRKGRGFPEGREGAPLHLPSLKGISCLFISGWEEIRSYAWILARERINLLTKYI